MLFKLVYLYILNSFCGEIYERWYFMVVSPVRRKDNGKEFEAIQSLKTIKKLEKEMKIDLQFIAPSLPSDDSNYTFALYGFCNCYEGIDILKPIEFSVKRPDAIEEHKLTKEDENVLNDDSSLLKDFIKTIADDDKESSESSSEEEDEEDIVKKEKKLKNKLN